MTTSLPIRLTAACLATVLGHAFLNRPASAWEHWLHHGYTQGTVAVVQPTTVHAVTLVPATAVSHLQVGTVPGLQVAPMQAALGSPALTVSTSPAMTYYVVPQAAVAGTSLAAAPTGLRASAAGAGDVTDQDYQILTTGLGGSFLNVQDLEKFLGEQLNGLRNKNGGLEQGQLTILLVDLAKGYLTSHGFGFLLDPTIDGVLKRLIGKVIKGQQAPSGGNNGTTPTNGNTTPTNGSSPIPAGGFTYVVSGQITLTPVQPGQGNQNQGNQNQGNQNQGNQNQGNQNNQGAATLPKSLTPDQTNLSQPAPPSR